MRLPGSRIAGHAAVGITPSSCMSECNSEWRLHTRLLVVCYSLLGRMLNARRRSRAALTDNMLCGADDPAQQLCDDGQRRTGLSLPRQVLPWVRDGSQ